MFKDIYKIVEEYNKGNNLIKFLRENYSEILNNNEITQLSYDIQAGSYVKKALQNPDFEKERGQAYATIIESLGEFDSILEAGIGEATSMIALIRELKNPPLKLKGFDISLSRVLYAQDFVKEKIKSEINFCVGDISDCPLSDNSVDLVYTIHALEPNGGNELSLVKELIRITNKYLVLFEPHYELGSSESREHIENHNYVKNLAGIADQLGHKVIENKILFDSNPWTNNNTGVIIIEKNHKNTSIKDQKANLSEWACPISKEHLLQEADFLFSEKSMTIYPIIKTIPILLKEKSILASHLKNFID
tara:strand:+ start:782 stop:1699 length:918 start_codon:yes stop_codon:yes gene_type:complete